MQFPFSSQFAFEVRDECQFLSAVARPLFTTGNPKDAQIWAFLLRHLGHTARATILKSWIGTLTTRTFRVLSGIVVLTFLALSTLAAAPFWRDNNALYINIGLLFGTAFLLFCLHYLQKPLAWNKTLSDRTIASLVVYVSFFAAVGPLCLLAILKSYALLPRELESIAQGSLIIGAILLFLLGTLRLHTIVLSTVADEIDKYYLPSQLPWALTFALYHITTGDSCTYNRTLIKTPLPTLITDAKEISRRIRLPAGISERDSLMQTSSIRHAIELSQKQIEEWLSPLFVELDVLELDISELPYRSHWHLNPFTMEIYDQLKVVRTTLSALETDAIRIGRWGFNLSTTGDEEFEKTFEEHITAHNDAVDKLNELLTNTPSTAKKATFRPDRPAASAQISLHLENAAKIMALIPLILPKVNHRETRWTNQVYSERAQAIRNLKTWVLLPLDCSRHPILHHPIEALETFSQIGDSHRQVDFGRWPKSKHEPRLFPKHPTVVLRCSNRNLAYLDPPSSGEHHFQCRARPILASALFAGQFYCDQPAAFLDFALVPAMNFRKGKQSPWLIPPPALRAA